MTEPLMLGQAFIAPDAPVNLALTVAIVPFEKSLKSERSASTCGPLCGGLAAIFCALMAGCGTQISKLPSANSKSVPGVPGGAILGYVWSSSDRTLRPILGVSGSAQVGQSIVPSGTYAAGAASNASSVGLVEDQKGNLFSLDLPLSKTTPVASGLPATAQIVFSPSGADAIVYATGGTSVTLISALATQPQTTPLALPSGVKLLSAIVSDAGTVLAAIQASPVAIEVLSAAGQLSPVTTVAQTGGMSFLPGVDDALVADGGKNTLSLLQNVSGSPAVQPLDAPGINLPVAVASSRDSRWAVVANGGDKNILRIDLKDGAAPAKLSCLCQATQLSALAGSASFRLNDLGNGPLWTADLSGPVPQLLFVPAIH
jgi:hypothetical protein